MTALTDLRARLLTDTSAETVHDAVIALCEASNEHAASLARQSDALSRQSVMLFKIEQQLAVTTDAAQAAYLASRTPATSPATALEARIAELVATCDAYAKEIRRLSRQSADMRKERDEYRAECEELHAALGEPTTIRTPAIVRIAELASERDEARDRQRVTEEQFDAIGSTVELNTAEAIAAWLEAHEAQFVHDVVCDSEVRDIVRAIRAGTWKEPSK